MTNAKAFVRLLGPLAIMLASGCAPQYHCYSGCNISCKFCAPPPLPYTHYEGCVCHSCAVSTYLSIQPLRGADDVGEIDSDTFRE